MTDTTLDQTEREAEEDTKAAELSRALRLGFIIGTPITFAVFFVMVYVVGNVELVPALITALWVAVVGGGFYGGITGLLTVLNRHGH